jgi:hypothetical protein
MLPRRIRAATWRCASIVALEQPFSVHVFDENRRKAFALIAAQPSLAKAEEDLASFIASEANRSMFPKAAAASNYSASWPPGNIGTGLPARVRH